jgi:hypothetical protein
MMCQNPHMEGHVFRANDRTAIVSENPWIPIIETKLSAINVL